MYATIVLEIQEQLGQVMIMFLQESQYCSLLLYVLDYLLYYLGNWSSHLVWFLVLSLGVESNRINCCASSTSQPALVVH